VYREENTGFGGAIGDAELGLFAVPHSLLYARPNQLGELGTQVQTLNE